MKIYNLTEQASAGLNLTLPQLTHSANPRTVNLLPLNNKYIQGSMSCCRRTEQKGNPARRAEARCNSPQYRKWIAK